MRGVDLHTRVFTWLVKRQFDQFESPSLADLKEIWPPRGLRLVHVPALDLDVGADGFEEAGLPPVLQQAVLAIHRLPRSDPRSRYASVEEAQRELREIFGARLREVIEWADPTGDRALVLLCTQGLAAHLLRRGAEPRTYEVDLSFLAELPVRPGFVRYGAKLVLERGADDRLSPRSIAWARGTCSPGEPEWESAKLAFRVSVATATTICDHAVKCHFLASNAMVVATRTKLSGSHPVRAFLRAFQYRTPAINAGALVTLIPERAIFHRLFALEWDGLCRLYARAKAEYRWESPIDDLARRGVADLPFYGYAEDASALYSRERRLAIEYLDAIGMRADPSGDPELAAFHRELRRVLPASAGVPEIDTRDRLADLLAIAIYAGTAYHEQVGGAIGDYLARPDFVVPTMVDGGSFEDQWPSRQTMVQAYMLGVLTNLTMPRIVDDFSPLVPHEAGPTVRRWLDSLVVLRREIEARNATRPQPLYTFHPDYLEISVSI